MPRLSKKDLQAIALKRVKEYFRLAKEISNTNLNLANRYVNIARRIAMKVNLTMPRELKRLFCKHCYSYFIHGKNSRVRIHKGRVVYYCEHCKKYARFVLKR